MFSEREREREMVMVMCMLVNAGQGYIGNQGYYFFLTFPQLETAKGSYFDREDDIKTLSSW
jgi:hypothetical protein